MKTAYTLGEISQISGAPYPTLVELKRDGVLSEMTARERPASGVVQYFDAGCAFAACGAAEFIRAGVEGDTIRKVVSFLRFSDIRDHLEKGNRYLVGNNAKLLLCKADAVLQSTGDEPTAVIIFDIARAYAKFLMAIEAMPETRERCRKRNEKKPAADVVQISVQHQPELPLKVEA